MLAMKSAYDGQRGSCAVTALHECAPDGWTAADVMDAAKATGYPHSIHSGGMDVPDIERCMRLLDMEYQTTDSSSVVRVAGLARINVLSKATDRLTLAQFARKNPTGTHLIIVHGHSMVLREGEIVDPSWRGRSAKRRRVWVSYRILNPGTGKYRPATQA